MRNRARTLASREPLSTPPKPTQDLPTLINNKAAFALLAFGLIVFLLWFLLRRQQRPFRDEDIEQQQQQQQGLLCRSESGSSESTKASSEPAASKDEPVESVLELPNDGRRLACRHSTQVCPAVVSRMPPERAAQRIPRLLSAWQPEQPPRCARGHAGRDRPGRTGVRRATTAN